MTTPSAPCIVKVSARPGRGFFQTLARWWWLELLLLITLPLVFGLLALAAHQKRPAIYESTALIEIAPPAGAASTAALKTYLNTQCAIIRSDPCLVRVVENLDLVRKWGAADASAAVAKLKPMVSAKPMDDSLLVRLTARVKDPALARDVAANLGRAYLELRAADADAERQYALREFNRQIRSQEDSVEASRKVLSQIAMARGMIYGGPQAMQRNPPDAGFERMEARMADLQVRKAGLEGRIKALEKGTHEALLAEAEIATPPNQGPAVLFRELNGKLAELKQLGNEAPAGEAARALEDRIAALREALRREADLALATMRGLLAAVNAEWGVARDQLATARGDLVTESLSSSEYFETKRNHDRETAMLDRLQQMLTERYVASKLEPPPAIMREEPVAATRPANHHPRREIAGAAFVGFVLAFIGMIPLALLLEGFSANRRMKKAAVEPEPTDA